MHKETTAAQPAFSVGDEVTIVSDEARHACGADGGTVVGHTVPAGHTAEPVAVIVAPHNGAPNNARIAPSDLKPAP